MLNLADKIAVNISVELGNHGMDWPSSVSKAPYGVNLFCNLEAEPDINHAAKFILSCRFKFVIDTVSLRVSWYVSFSMSLVLAAKGTRYCLRRLG